MKIADAVRQINRCGERLAQLGSAHFIVAPITPPIKSTEPFESDAVRCNQASAYPHDKYDFAIGQVDLLHSEHRNPWIDATPNLVFNAPHGFVESVRIDANEFCRYAVAIFFDADDEIATVSIREGRHVREEIARALVLSGWKRLLEVERRAFATAGRDEFCDIVKRYQFQGFIDHAELIAINADSGTG